MLLLIQTVIMATPRVFFDVTADGAPVGRIVMEVIQILLPSLFFQILFSVLMDYFLFLPLFYSVAPC